MAVTRATRGSSTSAFADGAVAQHQPVHVVGRADVRERPRPAARRQASAVSGVISDGFQTTVSPHTRASAVFHDQTATGKLKAEMTPTTPSGCQVSISRWPGRSEAMVRAVELAGQADREVADVDHLLDLAERLGVDLAGLDGDEVGQVVLVLASAARPALDQLAADAARAPSRHVERLVGAADRPRRCRPACRAGRPKTLAGDRRAGLEVAARGRRVDAAGLQGVAGVAAGLGVWAGWSVIMVS